MADTTTSAGGSLPLIGPRWSRETEEKQDGRARETATAATRTLFGF